MNVKTLQIITLASGLILLNACGSSSKKATPDANTTVPDANTTTPQVNVITHNGTTYGFVTSPHTHKVWLDRNLGAARVCESFNDTACYGDYYQWGRNWDGHEDRGSASTDTRSTSISMVGHGNFIISDGNKPFDWSTVDEKGDSRRANWSTSNGASLCPVGFRVPTIEELKAELLDAGSENIHDRDDAFASFLKLPSAGYRDAISGNIVYTGAHGHLWSSSSVPNFTSAHYLNFTSNNASTPRQSYLYGRSVRCVKN